MRVKHWQKWAVVLTSASVLGGLGVTAVPHIPAVAVNRSAKAVAKQLISQHTTTLAPGVSAQQDTYINQRGEQTVAHIVRVDLGGQATIAAALPNDGTKVGMQTVRGMANAAIEHGQNVVAAVNADFFNMATGEPHGTVIEKGVELHAPGGADRSFFGIRKDGTPVIGTREQYPSVKASLQEALGSQNILVHQGKVQDTAPISNDNAARTAVGITAAGDVFFVTIDGQQAPYSNGSSMADLAALMIEKGAVEAVDIDGGGSTTLVTRKPGEDALSVSNSPSDREERTVADSWLIVSKAKADHQFASATVAPHHQVYTPGSQIAFTAKGLDASGATAALPSGLTWRLKTPALGTIDATSGRFTGNGRTGDLTVQLCRGSQVVGTSTLTIATPDAIAFTQPALSVKMGAVVDLGLRATYKGRPVVLHDGDITWQYDAKLGHIDAANQLHSAATSQAGSVVATVANTKLSATLGLTVGQLPSVLYDFENGLGDWQSSTAGRGETSTVVATKAGDGPVRFGAHSLALQYDFTKAQTGTTLGAYAGPSQALRIPGAPTALGMWVHADAAARGYWLRMYITDPTGSTKPINLTDQKNGVDWTGWKYVEAEIPASYAGPFTTFPRQMIRLLSLKSGLPGGGPKTKGTLYVDNVRAVYGANVDDLTAPVVDSISVADRTFHTAAVNITAALHDPQDAHATGIDWTHNQIFVDGQDFTGAKGHYSYDKDGTLSLNGLHFTDGTHRVRVVATDGFGNTGEQTATFTVATAAKDTAIGLAAPSTAALGGTAHVALTAANPAAVRTVKATVQVGRDFPVRGVTMAPGVTGTWQADPVAGTVSLQLTRGAEAATRAQAPLATLDVAVPAPTAAGTALTTSVTAGTVSFAGATGHDTTGTFATAPQTTTIEAGLRLATAPLVSGRPGVVTVTDALGQPVAGVKVAAVTAAGKPLALGSTDALGHLSSAALTAKAQKLTLTAQKDQAYAFNYSTQVFAPSLTAAPTNLLTGATADPTTMKTFTWMTAPGTEKAILQLAPVTAGASGDHAKATGAKAVSSKAASAKATSAKVAGAKAAAGDAAAAGWTDVAGTTQLLTYSGDGKALQLSSVTATKLTPNTTYRYRVGDGTHWSDVRQFTTLAAVDHLTFNVFGDTQVTNPAGLADFDRVLTAIEGAKQKSDFAIHVGDWNDDQSLFKEADMTAAMFNRHPGFDSLDLLHVLGNHEYMGDDGTKSAAMMGVPRGNGASVNPTGTYAVDYGNLHIATIGWTDSAATMKAEMDWLRRDMNHSAATWKIVLTHQPVYNKNPADAGAMLFHDQLAPVCDELGIDLVFNGHDHSYGRTKPLVADQAKAGGTVYVAAGHTGDKTYEIAPTQPGVWAKLQQDPDQKIYLTAHVAGNHLQLLAQQPDGTVVDDTTLVAHALDRSKLAAAVAKAEAVVLAQYDPAGQPAFQKALAAAQKALAQDRLAPADRDAALAALTTAQKALKPLATGGDSNHGTDQDGTDQGGSDQGGKDGKGDGSDAGEQDGKNDGKGDGQGGSAGSDGTGGSGDASTGTDAGTKPQPGTGDKPLPGEQPAPGAKPGQKPGQGTDQLPGQKPGQKPGQEPSQKPGQNPDQQPGSGPATPAQAGHGRVDPAATGRGRADSAATKHQQAAMPQTGEAQARGLAWLGAALLVGLAGIGAVSRRWLRRWVNFRGQ
ncbi:phosphodiester glycosidase family protein [Lacticaseibacillus parakribbianus]|uniref:phosphodiester glycosidase family protein n=1 Tax=Lacticaseibacillus parakribbianus TaxID=2970927 RepID=UPI0021CB8118|nr:phosphodiester glycosidase family protein [Lacticaseibacillus parakribbianus]